MTDRLDTSSKVDELIEKRIQIAKNETKSDDRVVQIAWLARGIEIWHKTDGKRGHSPDEAERYIISSITRLLQEERREAVDGIGKLLEVQGLHGTWNIDPYNHGLYNGLEMAHAILKGVDPRFREAPKEWIGWDGTGLTKEDSK